MTIEDFAAQLLQNILRTSIDEGISREEAFTNDTFLVLQGNHEAYEPLPAYYRVLKTHVNGYDFSIDRDECDVYVTDFEANAGIHSISLADVRKLCEQATEFVRRAIAGQLDEVELDGPRQFIDLLKEHADILKQIRVFVLTNRRVLRPGVIAPVRVNGDQTEVDYDVVDIGRLHRLSEASAPVEEINIDFELDHGGALHALRFDYDDDRPYDLVLTLVPGKVLSDIYRKWEHRLLEQNVRVFLSARGGVNRGMRETVRDTPGMFAAYNNGLCATASEAVVQRSLDGTPLLAKVKGFQIVNGGQTTASLFYAARHGLELTSVAVPMKLVIVKTLDQKKISELVKEISKFTNSQNKVTASDLGAGDRFHRDLETESRNAVTTAPTGMIGTKWFYERARSQYEDERTQQETSARKARWDRENPSKQRLKKTDVAKCEMAWNQRPHTVCLGAEKNYVAFQSFLDVEPVKVDSNYFHALVAKAILFQACDTIAKPLVTAWKANIVAYAVAAFAHVHGPLFDLIKVWDRQAVTPETEEALAALVALAKEHLNAPPVGGQNIGEWSKKLQCWEQFKVKIQRQYTVLALAEEVLPGGTDMPVVDPRIARPELVAGAVWLQLHAWGNESGSLTSKQKQACLILASTEEAGRRAHASFYRLGSDVIRRAIEGGFELPPLT